VLHTTRVVISKPNIARNERGAPVAKMDSDLRSSIRSVESAFANERPVFDILRNKRGVVSQSRCECSCASYVTSPCNERSESLNTRSALKANAPEPVLTVCASIYSRSAEILLATRASTRLNLLLSTRFAKFGARCLRVTRA
jgi:hypothetical protein